MRELLARMDSAEFTEWAAFERLEPFGGPASDWRAGLIAATVLNVNRAENSQPIQPRQLIPWAEQLEPVQLDDDELVDAFDRLVGL